MSACQKDRANFVVGASKYHGRCQLQRTTAVSAFELEQLERITENSADSPPREAQRCDIHVLVHANERKRTPDSSPPPISHSVLLCGCANFSRCQHDITAILSFSGQYRHCFPSRQLIPDDAYEKNCESFCFSSPRLLKRGPAVVELLCRNSFPRRNRFERPPAGF